RPTGEGEEQAWPRPAGSGRAARLRRLARRLLLGSRVGRGHRERLAPDAGPDHPCVPPAPAPGAAGPPVTFRPTGRSSVPEGDAEPAAGTGIRRGVARRSQRHAGPLRMAAGRPFTDEAAATVPVPGASLRAVGLDVLGIGHAQLALALFTADAGGAEGKAIGVR